MAPVTRDEVTFGYRYILGRDPEPGFDFPTATQSHADWQSVRHALLNSYEASGSVYSTVFAGRPLWVKVPTPFGRQVHICLADIAVSRDILLTGHWEPDTEAALARFLTPDSVFVDVGANVGWFSLLAGDIMTRAGGTGRVVAVEANPSVLPYLMASIVESGLATRVAVKPYAVAAGPGLVQMDGAVAGNLGGLGIAPLDAGGQGPRHVVPTVRLDDILGDLDRIDLVKMDIEGAEPLALKGFANLIARFRPKILMELNEQGLKDVSGASVASLLHQMRGLGYRAHDFKGRPDLEPVSDEQVVAIVREKTYYDFAFLPE